VQIPGWLIQILEKLAAELVVMLAREVYELIESWAKGLTEKFGMKPDSQIKAAMFNQEFTKRCAATGSPELPTVSQVNFLRELVHQEQTHPDLLSGGIHEFPGPIKFTPPARGT
jgi:hypothetical protein